MKRWLAVIAEMYSCNRTHGDVIVRRRAAADRAHYLLGFHGHPLLFIPRD